MPESHKPEGLELEDGQTMHSNSMTKIQENIWWFLETVIPYESIDGSAGKYLQQILAIEK